MGLAWFPSASSSINTLMGPERAGEEQGSRALGAFRRAFRGGMRQRRTAGMQSRERKNPARVEHGAIDSLECLQPP